MADKHSLISEMNLNKFTLSFDGKSENLFLQQYYKDSLTQVRMSFILFIILYGIFGYFDFIVAPDFTNLFLSIRFLIVIPLFIIVLVLSFYKCFRRIWQLLLFISFIIAGVGITVMTIIVPEKYEYCAGLMLIFSAGYFFIKLRFYLASIAGWVTVIIYNVGAFFFTDNPTEFIISNDFFYISANLIGMFGSYYIELYIRRDFYLNKEVNYQKIKVEKANKNLEIKVEQRTEELKNSNIELREEIDNRIKIEHELRKAKDKAEQSDRLKSAFLANMSHEIRTPMNGIIGFASLLQEAESDEEMKEFVDIIISNGNHLLTLINDIIDISKVEAGLLELVKTEFSLNELMNEILEFFHTDRNVRKKGLKLYCKNELLNEDSYIVSDRTRLKQILINLMSNACKFTNEGYVEMGYSAKGEDLLYFYVKDTGTGLSEELKKVIFERFMQANLNNEPEHDGSGLGLAITKAFIKLLDGDIWVESEPGKGSVFYFTLPYFTGKKSKQKVKHLKNIAMEFNWKDKIILVAEDVETNYMLVKKSLRKTGVNLIWVKNGLEAVEECKKNNIIDLVLMDIRMPLMNGIEATKKIKKIKPELPVIAQTAYAMDGDREKSINAGCNDYIAKPINLIKFIELIGKYISG